jgi:Effector-associated domain 11/inactive STAND
MNNPKEKIRDLVGKAELKEALQAFYNAIAEGENVSYNDITQLNSQLSNLNESQIKGILSHNEEVLETAKISNRILSLLDTWNQGGEMSILDKLLYTLHIDKDADLGLLQMVNTDRIVPIRKFKRSFEDKKQAKIPFQFYFLSACPTEMPHSLASRIAYEIIEAESLELDKSVHYPYEEDIHNNLRSIKIEPLPLADADFAASRKKFKEYVQDRFKLTNTQSFELFIETGIPKLLYSHILTVFRITEDKWEADEGEILEYLQWMIDTFQTAHPDVPTFIFIFVINIRHLHDETKIKTSQRTIIERLEAFCQKNDTAIFKELVPIKDTHIESWLTNLGVDNPNDARKVINALNQTLDSNDRLIIEDEQRFHMKDVEPIQEKIVKYFRNKK